VRGIAWTLAVVIYVIATAAVPVASQAAPAAHVACSPQPGPVATLSAADNGRTVCAHRGERVDIALAVEPVEGTVPDQWWQPVSLSGDGLATLPNTIMPVRGTTLARYRATVRGTATLSSSRRPCAPAQPGGVSCGLVQAWSVTVAVR
jgi:hypothetical protein